MSTESSEFAVPEVVAEEKEVTKELKGTKRPAEVSICYKSREFVSFLCA